MATQLRILTLDELSKATVLTIVWDKFGNKFFKLQDGSWASEALEVISTDKLTKLRVKLYVLR